VSKTCNPVELAEWAPKLLERLRKLPELIDVDSDVQDQGLQAYVEIEPRHRWPAWHYACGNR